jgi:hypothetical protein
LTTSWLERQQIKRKKTPTFFMPGGIVMNLLQRRPWRWVPWFIAGLLSTVLFVSLPSLWQSATAAMNGNTIETTALQQFDVKPELASSLNPDFDEVAASHLEPNFY